MCDQKEKIERSILISLDFCKDYIKNIFYDNVNEKKIIICVGVKSELITDVKLFKIIEEQIYKNLLFFEEILHCNFFLSFRIESVGCGTTHCFRKVCEKNKIIMGGDQVHDPHEIMIS
jgi:hypothetical protein